MLSSSQPVIKILKRPPNLVTPEQVSGLNSCNVKPQPIIKSLEQVIHCLFIQVLEYFCMEI